MNERNENDAVLLRKVKIELRKRMRALRNTAPLSACQARSQKIIERLLGEPELAAAKHVALFYPIEERHEVDLRALDTALRARGVSVYYPSIDADTRVMTFRVVGELEAELEERGLGFREPAVTAAEPEQLDVVVVPCLAAGPSGHRLGYGAGFYDRALRRFCPPAWSVAVAYDYQLLADVPYDDSHDTKLAALVTDTRTLRF